jgi:hypothetical protein
MMPSTEARCHLCSDKVFVMPYIGVPVGVPLRRVVALEGKMRLVGATDTTDTGRRGCGGLRQPYPQHPFVSPLPAFDLQRREVAREGHDLLRQLVGSRRKGVGLETSHRRTPGPRSDAGSSLLDLSQHSPSHRIPYPAGSKLCILLLLLGPHKEAPKLLGGYPTRP